MKSSSFIKEDDYLTISGEVKNIGSDSIEGVEAITTFYDATGNVVKTTEAMIDFNPILPGQTSPWKTMTTDNPAIKTERTAFKTLSGGKILTDPEDQPAPRKHRHKR